MAEEFVRTAHFDAFSRRIDERILGVEKRMEQGFAHAAKEREQILVAMNQRFDGVNQRFDDLRDGGNERLADLRDGVDRRFDDLKAGMNQRFDEVNRRFVWIMLLFSPMLVAILGLVAALVQLVFAKS